MRNQINFSSFINCKINKILVLVILSVSPMILSGSAFSLDEMSSKKREDLLCTICLDIIGDLDKWLTSEATEDQIVEWMYGICEVSAESRKG